MSDGISIMSELSEFEIWTKRLVRFWCRLPYHDRDAKTKTKAKAETREERRKNYPISDVAVTIYCYHLFTPHRYPSRGMYNNHTLGRDTCYT